MLLLSPKSSWPRESCLAIRGFIIFSLTPIARMDITSAKIIIGRANLFFPSPAFRSAILSLFALSMERKYVVAKRKAREATIIKYCGTDSTAYSSMLLKGIEPVIILSILPNNSTATRISANTRMATIPTLRIDLMMYLSRIFTILPSCI